METATEETKVTESEGETPSGVSRFDSLLEEAARRATAAVLLVSGIIFVYEGGKYLQAGISLALDRGEPYSDG